MLRRVERDDMRRIARNWGQVVDAYVDELFDELDRKPIDRVLLEEFAGRVEPGADVADIGCGPGHVARHLQGLGLSMLGVDLCPEMVARAGELTPGVPFHVGDMLALDFEDGAWGGAIAFYSLINLIRTDVVPALREIGRVLRPGAPLLVAVHRGRGAVEADELFGQPVRMVANQFEPDELRGMLVDAGYEVAYLHLRSPYATEYPSERIYALGLRGSPA